MLTMTLPGSQRGWQRRDGEGARRRRGQDTWPLPASLQAAALRGLGQMPPLAALRLSSVGPAGHRCPVRPTSGWW